MPAYEDALAQLYDVLKPYARDGHVVGEQTQLARDLGLDSMKAMQVLLEIEDRFDISIPLNLLPDLHTVGDMALQIEKLTGRR